MVVVVSSTSGHGFGGSRVCARCGVATLLRFGTRFLVDEEFLVVIIATSGTELSGIVDPIDELAACGLDSVTVMDGVTDASSSTASDRFGTRGG